MAIKKKMRYYQAFCEGFENGVLKAGFNSISASELSETGDHYKHLSVLFLSKSDYYKRYQRRKNINSFKFF